MGTQITTAISFLVGLYGCLMIWTQLSYGWGALLALILAVCVVVAHNDGMIGKRQR